jgi:hypothetical protein
VKRPIGQTLVAMFALAVCRETAQGVSLPIPAQSLKDVANTRDFVLLADLNYQAGNTNSYATPAIALFTHDVALAFRDEWISMSEAVK